MQGESGGDGLFSPRGVLTKCHLLTLHFLFLHSFHLPSVCLHYLLLLHGCFIYRHGKVEAPSLPNSQISALMGSGCSRRFNNLLQNIGQMHRFFLNNISFLAMPICTIAKANCVLIMPLHLSISYHIAKFRKWTEIAVGLMISYHTSSSTVLVLVEYYSLFSLTFISCVTLIFFERTWWLWNCTRINWPGSLQRGFMRMNTVVSIKCLCNWVSAVLASTAFKPYLLKHVMRKRKTARYHLHSEITSSMKGKQHL